MRLELSVLRDKFLVLNVLHQKNNTNKNTRKPEKTEIKAEITEKENIQKEYK